MTKKATVEKSIQHVEELRIKLEAAEKEAKEKTIALVKADMKKYGLTVDDLKEVSVKTSAKVTTEKQAKQINPVVTITHKHVPPKYQDPTNPANVWSGRGRQAKWIKQCGLPLDQLVIKSNGVGNEQHAA